MSETWTTLDPTLNAVTFYRHPDGTVEIVDAPKRAYFSMHILSVQTDYCRVDGNIITVTGANETWTYRIVDRDHRTAEAMRCE